MSDIALYPKNDFAVLATLWDVDTTNGVKTPLITGTCTGFLATTGDPDATIANPTLTVVVTLIAAKGKWLVYVDAAKLQSVTMLDGLFLATGIVYVIVEQPNNIRAVLAVAYVREKDITLT